MKMEYYEEIAKIEHGKEIKIPNVFIDKGEELLLIKKIRKLKVEDNKCCTIL